MHEVGLNCMNTVRNPKHSLPPTKQKHITGKVLKQKACEKVVKKLTEGGPK